MFYLASYSYLADISGGCFKCVNSSMVITFSFANFIKNMSILQIQRQEQQDLRSWMVFFQLDSILAMP